MIVRKEVWNGRDTAMLEKDVVKSTCIHYEIMNQGAEIERSQSSHFEEINGGLST